MFTAQLTLTAFSLLAAAPEPIVLTPDTIAEHGYHFRIYVKDLIEKDSARPADAAAVGVRFGPLPGTSAKELEVIQRVRVVVREGDDVRLNMPLRGRVDPGNRVHLHLTFSLPKEWLPKAQLEFAEVKPDNARRTFTVNLRSFIKEK